MTIKRRVIYFASAITALCATLAIIFACNKNDDPATENTFTSKHGLFIEQTGDRIDNKIVFLNPKSTNYPTIYIDDSDTELPVKGFQKANGSLTLLADLLIKRHF